MRATASRTSERHPLGINIEGWKLRLTKRGKRGPSPQLTTYVGSRPEAVEALFSAMRTVNDTLRTADDDQAARLGFPELFTNGEDD